MRVFVSFGLWLVFFLLAFEAFRHSTGVSLS